MNEINPILGTNQDPFFDEKSGFPDPEDTVRFIADAGLSMFELCPEYLHQSPDKLTAGRRRAVRKAAADAGVRIIIHASYCSLNFCFLNEHVRRASIEQFKREIELASDLESSFITVHPGPPFGIAEWYETEMFRKMILAGYEELLRYARPVGVTICTENIPFPHLYSTEFMEGCCRRSVRNSSA
jgi:sugar phosphate isomerase/epimerase